MRVLVMGTGGIGGYFGARLAQAGHDVTFVARGRQLDALRTKGLRVESPRGDVHLPHVTATDSPGDAGDVDIVLFGVKLWDTVEAAEALKPLMRGDTAVVSFQNGVGKDEVLREVLGDEHVIGGVAYIAATVASPGVIRHSGSMARLIFGEYDSPSSPRTEAFLKACVSAAIDAEISPTIERAIWEKFVFLVGLSGTTSLARDAIGPIRSNETARAFLHDVMDEVVRVARAEGVDLDPAFARDRLAFADTIPATMRSSMQNDLEQGNRLEVEWLSGDVVARGQRLSVPTPCNRAIHAMLAPHSAGKAL